MAAPVPTLVFPVLAGSAGEAVDVRTLRFLLGRSLAEKEEEEKRRKAEVEENRLASLAPGPRGRRRGGRDDFLPLHVLSLVAALIVDNGCGMILVS